MTVELRGLRKSFGRVMALDDVSLTIACGEFIAMLGPSGSGKTTLLRTLAGLDFIDAGDIVIDARSMLDVPARQRGVGFVFQHYALFRQMTVARNVAFGLEVLPRRRRPPSGEIRSRVRSLLDLMEIGDLADRYPDQLSGGQRQRVALARALAIEPRLLLLDEPFGALDAKVRKNLRVWLRHLHDRMGLTSIFVTHDQAEAMEMADRVAVLRAGRIVQVDAPDKLYSEPASAFVHEFLGEVGAAGLHRVRQFCANRGAARCGICYGLPARSGDRVDPAARGSTVAGTGAGSCGECASQWADVQATDRRWWSGTGSPAARRRVDTDCRPNM